MHSNGDRRDIAPADSEKYDPLGLARAVFWGRALKAAIALIALAAAAAAFPALIGASFPMAGLIIFVAGMAFVSMPLCLYYEFLLKSHEEQVLRAKYGTGLHAGAH